ncbi:MAG: FecR family protein [Tannerella sp.]|jgi:ferric-dicitrate binding protein FerR (iron transport regulator)|nr:FecR family protein [Tannerella sp.]
MNREILYRFFNGTAASDEAMQVRKWLESSDENRHTFLKERRLFDMVLMNACEEVVDGQNGRRRTRVVSLLKEMAKVAAVAALTVAVCYGYFLHDGHVEDTALQTVSVPAGQRVNIVLPDGTNVWLNARSSLTYPASFNRNARTMTLDGEAYFEVARDETKPFVVHTAQGFVEVLGTHFNVNAYASENAFETTLMSGSLKVRLNGDPAGGVMLTPDEKAILKEGKLQIEHVDDYTHYRWREGLICFSNASFVEIMKELEKYYGISVQVQNADVTKYSYTGKFRFTDGIDYALWVLQEDVHFTYRRSDDNRIIHIE